MNAFLIIDPAAPEVAGELAAWIAEKREIAARDGHALRGMGCEGGFTIEGKSLATNLWHPLGWHHGSICFALPSERDAVLQQLQPRPSALASLS